VRVALKNINGVDSVDVSLSKGLAVATFKPGNTVRYEQLLRAIEKNGFTIKGSKLIVGGVTERGEGGTWLRVSGSSERLRLAPADARAPAIAPGKNVEVTGTVPEVPNGKTPDVLRYQTVTEK